MVLPFLLGFRLTCYYYRKAYYRSFWLSPPACAVAEPHSRYSGETRFPFNLQNLHRYALYLAIPVLAILWWDALEAFRFPVPHPEQFSIVVTEWRFGPPSDLSLKGLTSPQRVHPVYWNADTP